MSDLISVVITTYKRGVSEIRDSINSVLCQTYNNLELFIVDDSPNDYIKRDEVKSYCCSIDDSRVKYIQHKTNLGACAARNTGLFEATGKFIAFLDDDDVWSSDKMEKQVAMFTDDSIGLVFCDASIIEHDETKRSWFEKNKPLSGKVYDALMKYNFIGSTSFPMLRREYLVEVGGFDIEMEASQDWDTWIRITQKYEAAFVDEQLVTYYIHPGERITNNTQKRIRALQALNRKHKLYLENHKEALHRRKSYEMRLYILNRDISNAWKCYASLIKIAPVDILGNLTLLKAFARLIVPSRSSATTNQTFQKQ